MDWVSSVKQFIKLSLYLRPYRTYVQDFCSQCIHPFLRAATAEATNRQSLLVKRLNLRLFLKPHFLHAMQIFVSERDQEKHSGMRKEGLPLYFFFVLL